jgi:hypothetical protein
MVLLYKTKITEEWNMTSVICIQSHAAYKLVELLHNLAKELFRHTLSCGSPAEKDYLTLYAPQILQASIKHDTSVDARDHNMAREAQRTRTELEDLSRALLHQAHIPPSRQYALWQIVLLANVDSYVQYHPRSVQSALTYVEFKHREGVFELLVRTARELHAPESLIADLKHIHTLVTWSFPL